MKLKGIRTDMDYDMSPHTKQTLDDYLLKGSVPCGFIGACLANVFHDAVWKADSQNLRDLRDISLYIIWELPSHAHGSYEIVDNWPNNFKKEEELPDETN